jgi:hypothetical protein
MLLVYDFPCKPSAGRSREGPGSWLGAKTPNPYHLVDAGRYERQKTGMLHDWACSNLPRQVDIRHDERGCLRGEKSRVVGGIKRVDL